MNIKKKKSPTLQKFEIKHQKSAEDKTLVRLKRARYKLGKYVAAYRMA